MSSLPIFAGPLHQFMKILHTTHWAAAVVLLAAAGIAPAQAPSKVSPQLQEAMRTSSPNEPIRAWVFLADKGETGTFRRQEAERALTDRARTRRARNGVVVDRHDLPVASDYVREIRRSGARIRHVSRWLNAVSVEVDANALATLASLSFVRRLDGVRVFRESLPDVTETPEPASPLRENSTSVLNYGPSLVQNSIIDVPALHDQGYSGSGVMIAMLDAGFNNLEHEALVDIDILVTHDFVNGDSVVSDQVGQAGSGNHGTYTLSAIGGYQPGALIGPAYGATYILAKTENTDWERHVEEDDWIAGAEWADSIGTDIISSSLVTPRGSERRGRATDGGHGRLATIVAIGADMAASRGILVVNSAGNGGFVSLPANSLGSPADGDSVLAIGSVNSSGVRASSSSVGPSADGRIKPDVMAMGVAVVSASPTIPTAYVSVSGTSLSCPLVAGAAALLLEARPGATNIEIMDALRQTASQSASPNREYGWGIIDANAAAAQIPSDVRGGPALSSVVLHPAFPNPFNPATTIRYEIATRARVNLSIFDVRGGLVATLVDEVQAPGSRSLVWNARDRRGNALASGVYICRLVAGGERQSRKLVLLK
jgi:hypothetical protein